MKQNLTWIQCVPSKLSIVEKWTELFFAGFCCHFILVIATEQLWYNTIFCWSKYNKISFRQLSDKISFQIVIDKLIGFTSVNMKHWIRSTWKRWLRNKFQPITAFYRVSKQGWIDVYYININYILLWNSCFRLFARCCRTSSDWVISEK